MPRADYKRCKVCERPSSVCGELSHERMCSDCGPVVQRTYLEGLHDHGGPSFLHWRRRVAASVGAVLLDDIEATP